MWGFGGDAALAFTSTTCTTSRPRLHHQSIAQRAPPPALRAPQECVAHEPTSSCFSVREDFLAVCFRWMMGFFKSFMNGKMGWFEITISFHPFGKLVCLVYQVVRKLVYFTPNWRPYTHKKTVISNKTVGFTPWKINMEHNHRGLEDHFPF